MDERGQSCEILGRGYIQSLSKRKRIVISKMEKLKLVDVGLVPSNEGSKAHLQFEVQDKNMPSGGICRTMTKGLGETFHPKWHQDVLSCDYSFLHKYF